jgi:hypothetical protein
MRGFLALGLAVLLSACATMHGPRTITLSAAEIEQQMQTNLGDVLEAFKGLGARRPEVSLMPSSQRLLLEWSFGAPDEPAGFASRVTVEISGKPVLAASGNGIDLTEVRLDDVRLASLPPTRPVAAGRQQGRGTADVPDDTVRRPPAPGRRGLCDRRQRRVPRRVDIAPR